jgi:hypothetical protein
MGVSSRNVVGGFVRFITQTLTLETSNVLEKIQDGSKLVMSLMLLISLSDSKMNVESCGFFVIYKL